jgi:hypothetical protein
MNRSLSACAAAALMLVACGGDGDDETAPHEVADLIQITEPSAGFSTSSATVTVKGSRSNVIHSVSWSNSAGGSGSATLGSCGFFPVPLPLPCWQASVPLSIGANVITVTGQGSGGEFGRDTITITRN